MRIVSLLPSATETICVLGLEDQLVGVTHECNFPASVHRLPKVTRALIPAEAPSAEIDRLVRERMRANQALFSLDLPMLEMLRPDLIITQTLCDVCAVAEAEVRAAACALPDGASVLNLETQTLSQVFDAIRQVAEATGVGSQADEVVEAFELRINAVVARTARLRDRPRVVLLEWLDPPFSCGHWNPELVRLAGGVEGLGQEGLPSRTLCWDEVIACQPDVVFIACCGLDIERTMKEVARLRSVPAWHELTAVRSGRVYVADGCHYFTRPGPRLVDSLEMLAYALHPEAHPIRAGVPKPVRVNDSAFNVTCSNSL